ncbi:MAG TPA: M67 family metallopeptidase [Tepidisphaeraceae bacterium]|jgi:proteasome lid subunit RPN8/RPN11
MIQAPLSLMAAILADCDRRRPEEACGLLFGAAGGPPEQWARSVAADNVWPDAAERTTRYAIDPLVQMRAERQAVADGLDLVGFYHSHPQGPAVPSGFDLDRAWPSYVYLIVGYADPAALSRPVPRAWALDAAGTFVEHPIQTLDHP